MPDPTPSRLWPGVRQQKQDRVKPGTTPQPEPSTTEQPSEKPEKSIWPGARRHKQPVDELNLADLLPP